MGPIDAVSPIPVFVITWDEFDLLEGRGEGPPAFWGNRREVEAKLRHLLAEAAAVADGPDAWDASPLVRQLEAGGKVSAAMTPEEFLGE